MSKPSDAQGWRRFLQLEAADKRLFVQSVFLLPLVGLGLWLGGFKRICRWLQAGRRAGPKSTASPETDASRARQIAFLVEAASRRGVYRPPCLPAALVLQFFLQRQGISAELRIGVRKHEGKFDAHAWVEHQGLPLMESTDVHTRFPAFEQPLGHDGKD